MYKTLYLYVLDREWLITQGDYRKVNVYTTLEDEEGEYTLHSTLASYSHKMKLSINTIGGYRKNKKITTTHYMISQIDSLCQLANERTPNVDFENPMLYISQLLE